MIQASNISSTSTERTLDSLGLGENTIPKYLVADPVEMKDGSKLFPRQIRKVHFTPVLPEKVPRPYLIAASASCAKMLELDPSELNIEEFSAAFSGNTLLPGLDRPYATVYGCHSYGQWFGQLGDGRALSIGDVYTAHANTIEDVYSASLVPPVSTQGSGVSGDAGQPDQVTNVAGCEKDRYYGNHVYELQLKGCGRSPFSRGFDGKAVLRSSVREFLVSEAMHHLGVPTTRALSVVGTGETIHRAWYDSKTPCDSTSSSTTAQHAPPAPAPAPAPAPIPAYPRKYAPNMLLAEPGAVLCRMSRSFLRFGQLELFAQRQEWAQLLQLVDFVCFREYPDLLDIKVATTSSGSGSDSAHKTAADTGASPASSSAHSGSRVPLPEALTPGPVERYIALYRRVAQRTASLVAHWLRVGYVQGNMNSDNTLLSGATIDYGPYGWMERYDPNYQPFTSDARGNFAFVRQPAAMNLNVAVLGETTFAPLIQHVYMSHVGDEENTNLRSLSEYEEEVRQIAETEFTQYFTAAYNEVKRRKLGLTVFHSTQSPNTVSERAKSDAVQAGEDSGAGAAEKPTANALGAPGDPTVQPAVQPSAAEKEDGVDEEVGPDELLWRDLERLMAASDCDFTILFRELGRVAEAFSTSSATPGGVQSAEHAGRNVTGQSKSSSQQATMFVPSTLDVSLFPNIAYAVAQQAEAASSSAGAQEATAAVLVEQAMVLLEPAFYSLDELATPFAGADTAGTAPGHGSHASSLGTEWRCWLQRYRARLLADSAAGVLTPAQRRVMQDRANPKYVLRNWMAALAYERAQEGDYSVIHELTALLEHPYVDAPPTTATSHPDAAPAVGTTAATVVADKTCKPQVVDKWYRKTPDWARNLPGVAFMS